MAACLWALLLGFTPLARLGIKLCTLSRLSDPFGSPQFPCYRYISFLRERKSNANAIVGSIGFLATYWAIRKLYTAIRVD
jgi:hypothetical protein